MVIDFGTPERLEEYESGASNLATARASDPFCIWQKTINTTAGLFVCPASFPVVRGVNYLLAVTRRLMRMQFFSQ